MGVFANTPRPSQLPVATLPCRVLFSVSVCSFLSYFCILFLFLVEDTCVAPTGTPNGLVMVVVVAVATLFSESTLELWILVVGRLGVVECLYFKFSTFHVWTAIIQEAQVVILQV